MGAHWFVRPHKKRAVERAHLGQCYRHPIFGQLAQFARQSPFAGRAAVLQCEVAVVHYPLQRRTPWP
eukprot:5217910-Prorocentrum_lima.AAC.1